MTKDTCCNSRVLAQTLLALADPIRLRMLNLMTYGELNIHCLTVILKVKSHALSKHLVYLRNGRLIAGRRKGNTWHYFVRDASDSIERQFLEMALKWLGNAPEMEGDLARLKAIWKGERRVRASRQVGLPPWVGVGLQENAGGPSQTPINGSAEQFHHTH